MLSLEGGELVRNKVNVESEQAAGSVDLHA